MLTILKPYPQAQKLPVIFSQNLSITYHLVHHVEIVTDEVFMSKP